MATAIHKLIEVQIADDKLKQLDDNGFTEGEQNGKTQLGGRYKVIRPIVILYCILYQ